MPLELIPSYKLHSKITLKGFSGIITDIYRYTETELLEATEFPNLVWVHTHPFVYTITYDIPQSYNCILLERKHPDEPSKWVKIRTGTTFEFPDFEDVKLI